jgi:hypothetical protein
VLLADAVEVEVFLDLEGLGMVAGRLPALGRSSFSHALAEEHAIVANVNARSLDQFLHF